MGDNIFGIDFFPDAKHLNIDRQSKSKFKQLALLKCETTAHKIIINVHIPWCGGNIWIVLRKFIKMLRYLRHIHRQKYAHTVCTCVNVHSLDALRCLVIKCCMILHFLPLETWAEWSCSLERVRSSRACLSCRSRLTRSGSRESWTENSSPSWFHVRNWRRMDRSSVLYSTGSAKKLPEELRNVTVTEALSEQENVTFPL